MRNRLHKYYLSKIGADILNEGNNLYLYGKLMASLDHATDCLISAESALEYFERENIDL